MLWLVRLVRRACAAPHAPGSLFVFQPRDGMGTGLRHPLPAGFHDPVRRAPCHLRRLVSCAGLEKQPSFRDARAGRSFVFGNQFFDHEPDCPADRFAPVLSCLFPDGARAAPAALLVDRRRQPAAVYHVYRLLYRQPVRGKGKHRPGAGHGESGQRGAAKLRGAHGADRPKQRAQTHRPRDPRHAWATR